MSPSNSVLQMSNKELKQEYRLLKNTRSDEKFKRLQLVKSRIKKKISNNEMEFEDFEGDN